MSIPVWEVKAVQARPDYSLLLTFADGEQRIYDAKPLLSKPIYRRLKSLPFFLTAKAEYGTVIWDEDTDIAPEHLRDKSVSVQ